MLYEVITQYTFARQQIVTNDEEVAEKYSTTIVIPARNESGNIENAIKRIPRFGKYTEIIFVEGNSTDDTWEQILKVQEKYKNTHVITSYSIHYTKLYELDSQK